MPNFKSISFKMAVLQGGGQNLPSPCVCYPNDPMWNRVKPRSKFIKGSLNTTDTNITTQGELEELAVTLCGKVMKAVDSSTLKSYSLNDPKSPISQAIIDLIKEKCRVRRLYNSTHQIHH